MAPAKAKVDVERDGAALHPPPLPPPSLEPLPPLVAVPPDEVVPPPEGGLAGSLGSVVTDDAGQSNVASTLAVSSVGVNGSVPRS